LNRTCIYLDEACKMFPSGHDTSSGWYLSVFSEFILLLDGDERLKGHEWTAEDIRKYKETCYVICGGAFTEALKEARVAQKRGGLGFVQTGSTATHSSKIQEALPEEIYHRFGEHIILESPTRQDYARGIEMIHEDLRVERAVPIKKLLDEAEASGNGTRWLTLYLTRVLLENPTAIPVCKEQPPAPKPQGFDFFCPDTAHYCRQITKHSFVLRSALGRLYAQFNRVRAQITKGKSLTFRNYIYGTQDRMEAKLLDAIMVCSACGNVTADDGHIIDYLTVWREIAWEGLGSFPNELAEHGMLDLMAESWDLVSRVAELRAMVSSYVAAGRYSGVQS
jgi:hypothetical protein